MTPIIWIFILSNFITILSASFDFYSHDFGGDNVTNFEITYDLKYLSDLFVENLWSRLTMPNVDLFFFQYRGSWSENDISRLEFSQELYKSPLHTIKSFRSVLCSFLSSEQFNDHALYLKSTKNREISFEISKIIGIDDSFDSPLSPIVPMHEFNPPKKAVKRKQIKNIKFEFWEQYLKGHHSSNPFGIFIVRRSRDLFEFPKSSLNFFMLHYPGSSTEAKSFLFKISLDQKVIHTIGIFNKSSFNTILFIISITR